MMKAYQLRFLALLNPIDANRSIIHQLIHRSYNPIPRGLSKDYNLVIAIEIFTKFMCSFMLYLSNRNLFKICSRFLHRLCTAATHQG